MMQVAATTAEQHASDEAVRVPPRFRWLKRIIAGLLILAVVVGLVRWQWGRYARAKLQAEIDRYVAAGEPIYAKDFEGPAIPDERNAAVLISRAARLLDNQPDKKSKIDLAWRAFMVPDTDPATAPEILAISAEVRQLIRAACQRPEARWDWPQQTTFSPYDSVMYFALEIRAEIDGGRVETAVEDTRLLLRLSEHLGRASSFTGFLSSMACQDAVHRLIEAMLPRFDARIDRTAIKSLLSDLLDERAPHASALREAYAERASHVNAIRWVEAHPSWLSSAAQGDGLFGWLLLPMAQLDAVQSLKYLDGVVAAARASNYAEYLQKDPPPRTAGTRDLQSACKMFSSHVMPRLKGSYRSYWGSIAARRMASLGLAIRLYELDRGHLPERLDDLVPGYLPALPEDPFLPNHKCFDYCKADPAPLLQSPGALASIQFYLRGRPAVLAPATVPVSGHAR